MSRATRALERVCIRTLIEAKRAAAPDDLLALTAAEEAFVALDRPELAEEDMAVLKIYCELGGLDFDALVLRPIRELREGMALATTPAASEARH